MVSGGRQGRLLLLKSVKEVGYVRERAVFVLRSSGSYPIYVDRVESGCFF